MLYEKNLSVKEIKHDAFRIRFTVQFFMVVGRKGLRKQNVCERKACTKHGAFQPQVEPQRVLC